MWQYHDIMLKSHRAFALIGRCLQLRLGPLQDGYGIRAACGKDNARYQDKPSGRGKCSRLAIEERCSISDNADLLEWLQGLPDQR